MRNLVILLNLVYNIYEKPRRLVHTLRNKKYIFAVIALGTFLGMVPGSFAQSSDQPCATNTNPAQWCPVSIKDPIAFYAGTTLTGTAPATTTAAANILCCCKSDFASQEEVLKALGVQTGADGVKQTSCPKSPTCETIGTSETPNRGQFAPMPCSGNLGIDPGKTPLKGLSDFISKWYAAFFYLAVVLAIIQIFRGGFEYAIAAGNSSKTEEAKNIIIEAVIGLGVAMLAAGILVFLRGPGIFTFSP